MLTHTTEMVTALEEYLADSDHLFMVAIASDGAILEYSHGFTALLGLDSVPDGENIFPHLEQGSRQELIQAIAKTKKTTVLYFIDPRKTVYPIKCYLVHGMNTTTLFGEKVFMPNPDIIQTLAAINDDLLNTTRSLYQRNLVLEEECRLLVKKANQAKNLESIGMLASGVSHDFNNLLMAILGYAELMLTDPATRRQDRENLHQIILAVERAQELTGNLLKLSRGGQPSRSVIQLLPAIQETIKLLKVSLPAGVEISENITPDLPEVVSNTIELHQIFMNLGTNALRSLQGKPGQIEFGARKEIFNYPPLCHLGRLGAGEYACFWVKDTGIGLSEDRIHQIFEPFHTTCADGGGTGLGLALVWTILQRLNGAITVLSKPGSGSTFMGFIPIAPPRRPAMPASPENGKSIVRTDSIPR